jgi:DNA polymerase I
MTAMRAFKISDPAKVDKLLHRAPCKNVNFGVVYGLASTGLYDLMAVTYATAGISLPVWLTVEWCEKFINDWFTLYPEVKEYMELQFYRARRYGVVWDLFGRIRRVPEVQSVLKWVNGSGLRQAGNMPIQSSGAGLMKLAMGETDIELQSILDSGIWCWPLLSIHDEMITEAEEDYADSICEIIGGVMDNVMIDKQTGVNQSRVPILSDGHPMERWKKD